MTTPDPDATAARRDLLLLLLGQFERGTIADRDRALLRPLVEAEMATLDQIEAQAREPYEELQQRHNDLIAECRRQGEIHERTARHLKYAETRLDGIYAQAVDWSRLASPGDVGMTPGDSAFAEAGRIILSISDRGAESASAPGAVA